VFRNVGIYNSDAGELPKRKHNIFRTRRKFEIKNTNTDPTRILNPCEPVLKQDPDAMPVK